MIHSAVPASIFRAYDIRGVVGETLTAGIARYIGLGIGAEAGARGEQAIIVGRDGRHSSPELAGALVAGLRESGRDVVDIGMVPTPLLYFATHWLPATSGVMVTGSHNGPEYNGMKLIMAGKILFGDALQTLYRRIVAGEFSAGQGNLSSADVRADYIERICDDVVPATGGTALKVIVDCGNGVAGIVAPRLLRALGHQVVEMYCEVDGAFPNHHPDPSQPENLDALVAQVREQQADIGLAFDGDGDRLGVVDSGGHIIWPDRQLMVLARDVLSRNKGASIIYDVKCSRHLETVIRDSGGVPLMWKTGHSLIKSKMEEMQAPLAGELSGHIFFKERWYGFDDAIYAGARLLEIVVRRGMGSQDLFAEMPEGVSTPELRVRLPEDSHRAYMKKLKANAVFPGAQVIDTDGVRVEFQDGWGLVRASNTSPVLTLRFEADNQGALERVQERFRRLLQATADTPLQLPF
ncbi:MAG: phosphomannomutase/phosphoglucomutase [Gammaproteobacteria bacterium]|nr:phosphomannomutase/phosphoglucomutase [Gammaproteobacteria bacterium]